LVVLMQLSGVLTGRRCRSARQARGTRRLPHLGPGRQEHLFERLTLKAFVLQRRGNLAGGRDHEGVDANLPALEDAGGRAEVRQLAARAGTDVGPVGVSSPDLGDGGAVVRAVRLGTTGWSSTRRTLSRT